MEKMISNIVFRSKYNAKKDWKRIRAFQEKDILLR